MQIEIKPGKVNTCSIYFYLFILSKITLATFDFKKHLTIK